MRKSQILTTIDVTADLAGLPPGASRGAVVLPGTQQTFHATALDQSGKPLQNQPTITWILDRQQSYTPPVPPEYPGQSIDTDVGTLTPNGSTVTFNAAVRPDPPGPYIVDVNYSVSAKANDSSGNPVFGDAWVRIPGEAGGPFQVTYVGAHMDPQSDPSVISRMEGMEPITVNPALIAVNSAGDAVDIAANLTDVCYEVSGYAPAAYTYTVLGYVDAYSYFIFQATGTILEYLYVADANKGSNRATAFNAENIAIPSTSPITPQAGGVNLDLTMIYLGPSGAGKYIDWDVEGGSAVVRRNVRFQQLDQPLRATGVQYHHGRPRRSHGENVDRPEWKRDLDPSGPSAACDAGQRPHSGHKAVAQPHQ